MGTLGYVETPVSLEDMEPVVEEVVTPPNDSEGDEV